MSFDSSRDVQRTSHPEGKKPGKAFAERGGPDKKRRGGDSKQIVEPNPEWDFLDILTCSRNRACEERMGQEKEKR